MSDYTAHASCTPAKLANPTTTAMPLTTIFTCALPVWYPSPGPCGNVVSVEPGTGAPMVVPPPPYGIVVGATGSVEDTVDVDEVVDWATV